MYYGFLSLLLAVSFVDIFFHRGFGVAPLALLFVVLKMQADRAADILIKRGLSKPVSEFEPPAEETESWIPSPEKDPFASPFREPLRLEAPKRAEAKPGPKREPKAAAEPKKKDPFRLPKFHGAPHEVLGLDLDANTNMIKKAFRHWIKEFHPDHAKPGQEMQRATDRARHLNQAKESLLDRRRQMRKAA